MPSVTALVCAYNYERYVVEAIDSAFAQDYEGEIEVLVIDDGSTDGTPAVLAGYGDRIRVIRQPNGGLLDATAHGIREARGDLIAILDADDIWRPDKVRRQVDLMLARPEVGYVFSDLQVIDPEGRLLAPSFWRDQGLNPPRGRVLAHFLCQNYATAPSVMFRREFADHVLPIDPAAFFQDWWLAVKIAEVAEIDWLPEPLTFYRSHADNMSKKFLRNLRVDNRFRRWMLRRLDLTTVTPAEMRVAWRTLEDKLQLASTHGGRAIASEVPVDDADHEELVRRLAAARAAARQGDLHTAAREALAARACDPFHTGARDVFAALTDPVDGPAAPEWSLLGPAAPRTAASPARSAARGATTADVAHAVHSARRATEADPTDAGAWSELAELEVERGRPAAAAAAYRRVAALRPLDARERARLDEAERAAARAERPAAAASRARGKVLLCTETFAPDTDDAAIWTGQLAAQLARLGWELDVATRARPDGRRKSSARMRIHEFDRDPVAGVVGILRETAFDAVLAVGAPDSWPLPAALRLPRPGPRVAVLQLAQESTVAALRGSLHHLASYRVLLGRADAVGHVTASGADARLLRDLGIAGIHVPLAADAPLASEAAAGDDDGPLLLTVGDHEPMRRYGELLRALSHDDGEWRLVIAGNPSAFHGDVADEVKRLARVDSRVELRTGATLAEVDALMGRADLVLAASTGSVLAPTVVQAMAHGVPWIASPEYGGAADLAGGLVLDVGDFPAGVDHLLGDPRAHERLAAAGRAQFGRGHRWRESASRVDAMLRGVQELAPPPAAPDALAETEAVRAELLDALAAAPAGSTPYEPLPVEVLR